MDASANTKGRDVPSPYLMKLLLIGHGYLGQAITHEFRENGWDVSTVSLSGGDGSIACDVGDPDEVEKLPTADFIVHCAASVRRISIFSGAAPSAASSVSMA